MSEYLLEAEDRIIAGKIARTTLELYLSTNSPPELEALELPESGPLHQSMGVFITLKIEGKLRGCVGHIVPAGPLWQEIRDVTILSATRDTRFTPVTVEEIPSITLSLTVLSPLRRVTDPFDFEVGTHGILFEVHDRRAVFLPQVAPEWGWDQETTFQQLAKKARLPNDAWKDPAARFYLFEGQVFKESGEEEA